MDITKMLTISTGHIKESTYKLLENFDNNLFDFPAFWPKEDYGWFIYVGNILPIESYCDTPDDLKDCMRKAWENDCEWLCLDCDAMVYEGLPTYDW